MTQPYIERRARLGELGLTARSVQVPPYWTHIPIETMLDTAASHALEGIVSKRLDSIYRPGTRSRMWLKTALRATTEAIIVGWATPTSSSESGAALGSLVLGAYNESGRLVYVGHVGTGFSTADRRALRDQLVRMAVSEPPLDLPAPTARMPSVHWVEPRLVGTVEYREFAGALRHPPGGVCAWTSTRSASDHRAGRDRSPSAAMRRRLNGSRRGKPIQRFA